MPEPEEELDTVFCFTGVAAGRHYAVRAAALPSPYTLLAEMRSGEPLAGDPHCCCRGGGDAGMMDIGLLGCYGAAAARRDRVHMGERRSLILFCFTGVAAGRHYAVRAAALPSPYTLLAEMRSGEPLAGDPHCCCRGG
nr:hypothetical protein Iba_chr13dCG6730 [Ipomoea batatas]